MILIYVELFLSLPSSGDCCFVFLFDIVLLCCNYVSPWNWRFQYESWCRPTCLLEVEYIMNTLHLNLFYLDFQWIVLSAISHKYGNILMQLVNSFEKENKRYIYKTICQFVMESGNLIRIISPQAGKPNVQISVVTILTGYSTFKLDWTEGDKMYNIKMSERSVHVT